MDSSQRTRMINEAANIYLARSKTVDSSLLTLQRIQKASYAGAARLHTPAYYNGSPTVNPIIYDPNADPLQHSYTNGYTATNNLAQQESVANTMGGAAIYGDPDYSTAPPGILLLNPSTCSTILNTYNNNTPQVSIPPPTPIDILIPKFGPLNAMVFNGNSFVQLSTDSRFTQSPLLEDALYSNSSDFTIEFFLQLRQPTNNTQPQNIFYIGNDTSSDLYKMIGQIRYVSTNNYTFNLKVSTFPTITFGQFSLNKWYYIAIVRNISSVTAYLDGVIQGVVNLPTNIPATGGTYTTYLNSIATLGASYASTTFTNGFTGYLSNFRWTKGKALYTDPVFQVPLPFSDYTTNGLYWSLYPYFAVLLISSSASSVLTNTGNPPTGGNAVSVSTTDAHTINASYNAITYLNV
jgi:hypothetical protein